MNIFKKSLCNSCAYLEPNKECRTYDEFTSPQEGVKHCGSYLINIEPTGHYDKEGYCDNPGRGY